MNESLVKYLAGLLDADGSLSFAFRADSNKENRFFPSLFLRLASSSAVDKDGFVPALPELTGMGTYCVTGSKGQFRTWTVVRRADLEMLLPRLVKHMVIKARHWAWLLEMWRGHRGTGCSGEVRETLSKASKESRINRRGPIHPKNHPTWAWLAGYLDGDGWYRYRYDAPPQNYWSMSVGAVAHVNDAHVFDFLVKAFGGSIREHGQSDDVKVWVRNLGVKDASFALRFLPNLSKHSRLKRHKINQMIHHHRQRLSALSPTG